MGHFPFHPSLTRASVPGAGASTGRVREWPLSPCQGGCHATRIYVPAFLYQLFPGFLPTHYRPISCLVFSPNCHRPHCLFVTLDILARPPQQGAELRLLMVKHSLPGSCPPSSSPRAPGPLVKSTHRRAVSALCAQHKWAPSCPAPLSSVSTLPLLIGIQSIPSFSDPSLLGLLHLPTEGPLLKEQRV